MPTLYQHRWLLANFTAREFASRYSGSTLGLLWVAVNPLVLLAVYSFVFGQLFNQRIAETGEASYTLFVAVALWPWIMFADSIQRGMGAIQANAGLIRKVAFPHALLVHASVAANFAIHLIGYAAALLLLAASGQSIKLSSLPWALVLLALLFVFTIGLAAFLAALQTVIKDVEQALPPILMMLHFLTPVLYPLSVIPQDYRGWLQLNPLALFAQRFRDLLLAGGGPVSTDVTLAAISVVMLVVGLVVFNRLSPHFEDFL